MLRSDGDILIFRLCAPVGADRAKRNRLLAPHLRDVRMRRSTVFIRSKTPTIR